MMQATDFRDRDNAARCWRLNRPRFRRVPVETLMAAARVVVVPEIIAQQALQMALVENDNVIK